MDKQVHKMVVAGEVPDGGTEYACPLCDRRVIFDWVDGSPSPHIQVLEHGDLTVSHIMGSIDIDIVAGKE